MPTRTRYRAWTRPSGGDKARITDSVGLPLDEIDSEVEAIDTRLTTVEGDIASVEEDIASVENALGRAVGVFSAANLGAVASAYTLLLPETLDQSGWYIPATGRYTPQVAGYYQLHFSGNVSTAGDGSTIAVRKNGLQVASHIVFAEFGAVFSVSTIVSANGTTDWFSVGVEHPEEAFSVNNVRFSGFLIGRS